MTIGARPALQTYRRIGLGAATKRAGQKVRLFARQNQRIGPSWPRTLAAMSPGFLLRRIFERGGGHINATR
jgi:hypothetical protein